MVTIFLWNDPFWEITTNSMEYYSSNINFKRICTILVGDPPHFEPNIGRNIVLQYYCYYLAEFTTPKSQGGVPRTRWFEILGAELKINIPNMFYQTTKQSSTRATNYTDSFPSRLLFPHIFLPKTIPHQLVIVLCSIRLRLQWKFILDGLERTVRGETAGDVWLTHWRKYVLSRHKYLPQKYPKCAPGGNRCVFEKHLFNYRGDKSRREPPNDRKSPVTFVCLESRGDLHKFECYGGR